MNDHEKLTEIYYQPENLWKGRKAIKLLQTASKLSHKKVAAFLAKQAFWQVYTPAPKKIERPHFEVSTPNEVHQFDLLYMPHDTLYRNIYKYILNGVDEASRYKVSRPLRTKKASEVAEMLADIYKVGPLKYPKVFQCDNGSEFKADVTKLLEKHGTEIKRATTKYRHTYASFVESYNKLLAQELFKIQDAQELQDPKTTSKIWLKYLYRIVHNNNNRKTAMIGMKPKDAIKLAHVELVKPETFPSEEVLPEDGLYRYLYQHGEQHGDQRKRATDLSWSKDTYRLDTLIKDPGNRVLYFLADGPTRSFVREELMLVAEDTEIPPEYVKDW